MILCAISFIENTGSSNPDQVVYVPEPATISKGAVDIEARDSTCDGNAECGGRVLISCDSKEAYTIIIAPMAQDTIVGIIRKQPTKLELSLNGDIFSIYPRQLDLDGGSEASGGWNLVGDLDFDGNIRGGNVQESLQAADRLYLLTGSDISQIELNENIKKFAQNCYDLTQKTTVKAVKAKPTEIPRDKHWSCKNGTTYTCEVRTMIRKSSGVMTIPSKESGLNFKAPFRYCQSSHCTWVIDGATDEQKVFEKSGSVYMTIQDGSAPLLTIFLPTGELDCIAK